MPWGDAHWRAAGSAGEVMRGRRMGSDEEENARNRVQMERLPFLSRHAGFSPSRISFSPPPCFLP